VCVWGGAPGGGSLLWPALLEMLRLTLPVLCGDLQS